MFKFHSTAASFQKHITKLLVIATEDHVQQSIPQTVLAGDHWQVFERELAQLKVGNKGKTIKSLTTSESVEQLTLAVLPNQVSRGNSPTRKSWIYQYSEDLEADPAPAVMVIVDDQDHAAAAVSALARRLRLYNRQKSAPQKRQIHLLLADRTGQVFEADNQVKSLGETVAWTCRICDTAPADMNPRTLSKEIRKLFKDHEAVDVTEIKGDKLLDEHLNAIHAVGRASEEEPRMLVLDYQPPKGGGGKPIALVGKGVTYDSGGLSLKIQGGMVGMKMDLGGAAAVIGAFKTLVDCQFPRRVIASVGLVENAIGPNSYRNDDIIAMHSGKTVEINNTDAEGRLVMADCASYLGRKFAPELLIDAATLTGAQLVATGLQHAAIVSNDDALENLARESGKISGDLVAPLPFAPEFFEEEFKSLVADMRNSVKNRMNAQSSCAAQFVYSHIDDLDLKWLHIDLAGPASTSSGLGTGFGVALISRIVQDWGNR
jgi:probable aminopeptidase NPEPL1